MAGIIPETQRPQLASRRTGTPGAEFSLAGAIQDTAKVVGKFERKAAQERRQESDLRRGALVDSRTAILGSKFSASLSNLQRSSTSVEDYNDRAALLLNSSIDEIEDDDIRASFSNFASNRVLCLPRATNSEIANGVGKL